MKKNIEESNEENTISTFDSWNFYKSRFARILPVYYTTFVLLKIIGVIKLLFQPLLQATTEILWFLG